MVTLPGRPRRLDGVPYDAPGPVFHCRIGSFDRSPSLCAGATPEIVISALRFYHSRNVAVLTYCLMPDHLHVLASLVEGGRSLSRWVADFKRWTTREAKKLRGAKLRWQPGFYEHVVRRNEDVTELARYILANPVRAGLTDDWRAYRWSGSLAWEL
jgi:putative transposase